MAKHNKNKSIYNAILKIFFILIKFKEMPAIHRELQAKKIDLYFSVKQIQTNKYGIPH